jgi:urea carboxylase
MVTRASRIEPVELPPARYDYGGDDFVFVDLDQAMSFQVNFKAQAICKALAERKIPGVVEIAPGNASYLIRIDPDTIAADELIGELKEIERQSADTSELHFTTRVVDMPVLYDDPWTHETLMKFRDRHQSPDKTDIEFVTEVNGFRSTDEFIEAHHHAPYFVTMVGFVPGTPWCLQMVPIERQLQVPKYVRPRTDTPDRAISHGGAFLAIYPVQGPGGYQLFGRLAPPIFDPHQELADFATSVAFPRPGDIFKLRPVDRSEYDRIREQVEAKTFRYHTAPVEFEPGAFYEAPDAYTGRLLSALST